MCQQHQSQKGAHLVISSNMYLTDSDLYLSHLSSLVLQCLSLLLWQALSLIQTASMAAYEEKLCKLQKLITDHNTFSDNTFRRKATEECLISEN